MNPEIKQRWVTALRSGEYKQTRRTLRDSQGFCCLGVLCDIVKENVGGSWITVGDHQKFDGPNFTSDSVLPAEVVRLVGIDNAECILPIEMRNGSTLGRVFLIELNDLDRLTFPQIADVIEHFL